MTIFLFVVGAILTVLLLRRFRASGVLSLLLFCGWLGLSYCLLLLAGMLAGSLGLLIAGIFVLAVTVFCVVPAIG